MDRCPQKDFSFLSLPLCRYCFMGQAFQFEKSLLVKTQPVYDAVSHCISSLGGIFSDVLSYFIFLNFKVFT